ncbi:MAG: CYTH domain-containing protein [Acidimicrobiia bacterium]
MAEIERKWSVPELPDDLPVGDEVRQGYIALDGDVEVRVRDREGTYSLTVKGGGGLERAEVEMGIGRDDFDELWSLARGRTIEKTRHVTPVGDAEAEVDVYRGELDGVRVAEVEFDSADEANAFEPPDWFGDELTDDDRWSNRALAVDGRPPDDA